jgi:hypothetical protein
MKLPFLSAMRDEIVRNSRQPSRVKFDSRAALETSLASMPGQMDDDITVKHIVSVWFAQRVSVQEWNDLAHRDELARRAAESIARRLYGPLTDKLLKAREALWEDRLGDHKAAEVITEIIDMIRGESQ